MSAWSEKETEREREKELSERERKGKREREMKLYDKLCTKVFNRIQGHCSTNVQIAQNIEPVNYATNFLGFSIWRFTNFCACGKSSLMIVSNQMNNNQS